MRKILMMALLSVSMISFSTIVDANLANAKSDVYTSFFSNNAASGYDVVAYFTESRPVRGSKDFVLSYKGTDWRFSSQKNLDLFKANPTAYEPQYGGHCAYAMASNSYISSDPDQWSIVDGKLYLNYDKSSRDSWLSDTNDYISKADNYWRNR